MHPVRREAPAGAGRREVAILYRHGIDAASRPAYERLRRRLLLARVQLAGGVGLCLLAFGAGLNLWVEPPRLEARLWGFAVQSDICLLTIILARWTPARRFPRALALVLVLGLGTSLFYTLGLSPAELDVLTAPITCIMVGSTLVFPWGALTQTLVCLTMGLGYAQFLWPHMHASGWRAANVALSLALSAAVSVVGALVLERSRAVAFAERRRLRGIAVQRRHMIEVGRNLRETLSVDAITVRVLEHAGGLIHADTVILVLQDQQTALYRVVTANGDPTVKNMVGLSWDDDFRARFFAALAPAEVRESPGSALDEVIMPLLGRLGMRRALVAAVGPYPMPAGFLAWMRRSSSEPFTRVQWLAAQGIADQAATAMAAARLYEQAERASTLKSEFVSTMSHELRTPLNVIMGYNQILSETLPPDPETAQTLRAMQRAALELLDLIEGTLDIGRLEAGRMLLQETKITARDLFSELAAEFAPVPRSANVAVIWDTGDIELVVDRRKLKTILKNLVSNALKFTAAGTVRVECRPVDDGAEFRVSDTGIGIKPSEQTIVFEMFRQADSSDSRLYGGSGLGLYIVKRLVSLLAGQVTLESRPGSGATFTITVPRAGALAARDRAAA